jgi:hypothetical protein
MNTAAATESWLTSELLEPVADINVHCLELICQRVRDAERGALPRVLGELAPDWSALAEAAIARIARVPYVLVASGFGGAGDAQGCEVRESAGDPAFFDPEHVPGLAREIIVLTWHVARTRRQAARLLLGMESRQIDLIASCSLRELERRVDGHNIDLRLRWADRPGVWRHLLAAAASGDEGALARAQLRGLQLLAADTWRQAGR